MHYSRYSKGYQNINKRVKTFFLYMIKKPTGSFSSSQFIDLSNYYDFLKKYIYLGRDLYLLKIFFKILA